MVITKNSRIAKTKISLTTTVENIFCHCEKCSSRLMVHSAVSLFMKGHPGIMRGSWLITLKLSPNRATNINIIAVEILKF